MCPSSSDELRSMITAVSHNYSFELKLPDSIPLDLPFTFASISSVQAFDHIITFSFVGSDTIPLRVILADFGDLSVCSFSDVCISLNMDFSASVYDLYGSLSHFLDNLCKQDCFCLAIIIKWVYSKFLNNGDPNVFTS